MKSIVFLVLLYSLMPIASAAGVSSPYWDQTDNKNPLYLTPGEAKDFQFILQNGGSTQEDVVFKVKILQGAEIATITDPNQNYLVPAKRTDIPVNVHVTAPNGAPVGTTYKMEFEFTSSPAAEAGQFQFGSAFIQRFNVIISEEGKESALGKSPIAAGKNILIPVIIILLVILIIFIIAIKRKRHLHNNEKSTKATLK